jgi:hypothetical protein
VSSPQHPKSPFSLFKNMLATLLSVPKEELDEAPGHEQAEVKVAEEDASAPNENA